ncbi:hypothetical protein Droror1_Dr00020667 [Drosera rotundifolia]
MSQGQWSYTKVLSSTNDVSIEATAALEIPREKIDELAALLSQAQRDELMNPHNASTLMDVYVPGTVKTNLYLTRVWNKRVGYLGKGDWGEFVQKQGLKKGDKVILHYVNFAGFNELQLRLERQYL